MIIGDPLANCVYIYGVKQTLTELLTQDLTHLQLLSSGQSSSAIRSLHLPDAPDPEHMISSLFQSKHSQQQGRTLHGLNCTGWAASWEECTLEHPLYNSRSETSEDICQELSYWPGETSGKLRLPH